MPPRDLCAMPCAKWWESSSGARALRSGVKSAASIPLLRNGPEFSRPALFISKPTYRPSAAFWTKSTPARVARSAMTMRTSVLCCANSCSAKALK